MKPIEVKEHYGTWTKAMRELDFSVNLYQKWVINGEIPLKTQVYIEGMTKGGLKADDRNPL